MPATAPGRTTRWSPDGMRGDDDGAGIALTAHAVGYYDCAPDWTLPPRSRPHHQLWVITAGSTRFRLGGLEPVLAGPRSVIMIPPQVTQQAEYGEPPLHTWVAHFTAYDRGEPRPDLWPPQLLLGVRGAGWDRILADVTEAGAELAARRPGGALIANAALTDAVGRLGRVVAETMITDPAEEPYPAPVVAAIDHLRRHYDQELTVTELARAVHVSPEQLRRLFRRATGQAPSVFVQRFRVGVARRLLRETDLPVAQIARRAGFGDPFYFSRVFTALEGTAPSRYRALGRAEPGP